MNSQRDYSQHNEAEVGFLVHDLSDLVKGGKQWSANAAAEKASRFLDLLSAVQFSNQSDLLCNICFFFFEIGNSSLGISFGKKIAERARAFEDIFVQRRISNILGGQFCDIADFSSAMEYLEVAVVLARKIGDRTLEAACLGNVIAVLQEMGHYRQAIAMATRVLELDDCSKSAVEVKLQCSSIGLFAAHRIGDQFAAASFLSEGQSYLSEQTEPLRRAFFEKGRAFYLVDLGETIKAQAYLTKTRAAIGATSNFRINTLLNIAEAVCAWSLESKTYAREELEKLYIESKTQRIYHNFVLQALIKVYSDANSPSEAAAGLTYARELVEYTTSVKKAKFYRQLANKRVSQDQRSTALLSTTLIDPFGHVKDWLVASDILGPVADAETIDRRSLTKHEELTVIHEDMAKLRAATLRRDIRTDAVDTAENWAIAAEFFDDETGQHCFRVGHLAAMLARKIGMDEIFCVQVEHAARLHDIGKIAVNEVILLKPGPLDASEMAAMRLHTEVGAQILSGSDDPTLIMAVEVARHHHEWWNGNGYPVKLIGSNIPVSARVCAFADVYDALTHARAYKKAWTHERALAEIIRLAGVQFDPDMLGPFCKVLDVYRDDLRSNLIPGFIDMDSNALIASRRKLLETIGAESRVDV